MRTIHLHGHLSDFGTSYRFDVATAGEAIRFISAQVDGFADRLRIGSYFLVHGDADHEFDVELDDVNTLHLGEGDLHLIPAVDGAKRGGLLKAILGVVLVGAALFFSGGALATPLLGGMASYGTVAALGVSMALSGISQLLSPKPKDEKAKNDGSFTNVGPSNTYEQGGAIPLWYGKGPTGGVLISGSTNAERI